MKNFLLLLLIILNSCGVLQNGVSYIGEEQGAQRRDAAEEAAKRKAEKEQ